MSQGPWGGAKVPQPPGTLWASPAPTRCLPFIHKARQRLHSCKASHSYLSPVGHHLQKHRSPLTQPSTGLQEATEIHSDPYGPGSNGSRERSPPPLPYLHQPWGTCLQPLTQVHLFLCFYGNFPRSGCCSGRGASKARVETKGSQHLLPAAGRVANEAVGETASHTPQSVSRFSSGTRGLGTRMLGATQTQDQWPSQLFSKDLSVSKPPTKYHARNVAAPEATKSSRQRPLKSELSRTRTQTATRPSCPAA